MDEDLAAEIEGTKAYILSLCSAIGGLEEIVQEDGSIGQVYCVGDEALACLRDLKKAIRLDSQNNERVVLNALVECNVVETDIVPLLLSFRNQRNDVANRFILACVELLVPMTWPIEKSTLDEEEAEDDNPNVMQCYRKYKMDLLTEGVFETILTMLMKSVRIPHRDRSIIDHTTIRLALYLFRNLAAIPDLNMPQSGTIEQIRMSHMQEVLMIRYYEADVIEFLLTIASNSERQSGDSEWNVLVLESLYNLMKHIDPKDVFLYKIADGTKKGELHEISAKLSNLLTEESASKRLKTAYVPTRHNRFGGTYVLDWDGKKRISHKQEAGYADSAFIIEGEKKASRVGNKRKLEDTIRPRKVYQNMKALMYLKLTAQSFITSCFNAFYECMLKDIQREDAKIVEQDYARYFFTMRWFLEYHMYEQRATEQRKADALLHPSRETRALNDYDNKDFDFALVASALDLKTVLYCLRHMRDKLEQKAWFDVQMTVDCFRQMLVTIGAMYKSEHEEYREIAEHIQSNLYYEQTAFDLFIDIVKCYKSQSYGYLKSVVMLTHVLLKLLDQYQKGKKMLFVRKKKPQKKKKKPVEGAREEEGIIATVSSDESENEEVDHDAQRAYRDSVFKFSAFEEKYISKDVIHAYTSLLECYRDLQPEYFMCISTMFHRLMVKRKAEYLFWKLPVMDLFNRILIDSKCVPNSSAFSELKQFIRYSTRQFFKGAAEYPLLFVEALIPTIKSNRSMWEMPDEHKVREKENYLADVNYIPPTSTSANRTTSTTATTDALQNNQESIDDDMMDYYFSEFDRKKQEEAQSNQDNTEMQGTTVNHHNPEAEVVEDYDFFGNLSNVDVGNNAIKKSMNNETAESTKNTKRTYTDSDVFDGFTADDLDLDSMVDR